MLGTMILMTGMSGTAGTGVLAFPGSRCCEGARLCNLKPLVRFDLNPSWEVEVGDRTLLLSLTPLGAPVSKLGPEATGVFVVLAWSTPPAVRMSERGASCRFSQSWGSKSGRVPRCWSAVKKSRGEDTL